MKTAVAYYSKTGNTRKIAEAMAESVGTHAIDVSINDLVEPLDLLFVGGAIYGGKLDEALVSFIKSLTPEKIKRVAVFSTYFTTESATEMIGKLLAEQKVAVADECFSCKGRFLFFSRKMPGSEDVGNAKRYAVKIAGSVRN